MTDHLGSRLSRRLWVPGSLRARRTVRGGGSSPISARWRGRERSPVRLHEGNPPARDFEPLPYANQAASLATNGCRLWQRDSMNPRVEV